MTQFDENGYKFHRKIYSQHHVTSISIYQLFQLINLNSIQESTNFILHRIKCHNKLISHRSPLTTAIFDVFIYDKRCFSGQCVAICLIINKTFELMNFGPPALCPPYCFLLILTPQYFAPLALPTPKGHSQPETLNAETISVSTCEEWISVTREDLLGEGYGQTKRAWTEEEDQLLMKLCANKHARFEEIAAFMPDRNAKMCYSRYRRLTNQSKDCWSKAENQKLASCVELYGQNWHSFASLFPNRNHKQLKDHYDNYLRPNLLREQWTVEDDLQLIDLLNKYGKNWKLIEQGMPDRSRNQLKNRFFGKIKRIHNRNMSQMAQGHLGDKLGLQPI